ncbi:MAG: hypothetical protein LBV80_04380 [Deltaproteobacteria bacterium]|jgi:hypothetical protein|nr:hypothetical protein [Deltaproteobacteria bacterium]
MRILMFLFALLLLPCNALALTVPGLTMGEAASGMGQEMDAQLAQRFGHTDGVNGISIIVTTPVDINNFEESSPVARQMQESLAHWLVGAGYSVQEIRKGRNLLFRQDTGELLLTRDKELAALKSVNSVMILVGTYTVTSKSVIFNVRLMQTGGTEVYAMSSVSLPINGEMRALLGETMRGGGIMIEPTVYNRLP